VFRNGTVLYVLRGQRLSTYTTSDVGELQIVREDTIGTLGARDVNGAVAYHNGHLFISGEAGLEIYDLRNVGSGASAPQLVSTTPGMHYRRLVANGNLLAGLYPATDLPCAPAGTLACHNAIDIISIANLATPVRVGAISSLNTFGTLGFNDIAFNRGFLYAATEGGIIGYNVVNATAPVSIVSDMRMRSTFLVSNGGNIVGIGNDQQIHLYSVGVNGVLNRFTTLVLPFGVGIDRANPIAFHPQAWVDEQNGRLITMIDEINPLTGHPARTIAFDVFDYSVPMWEGSFERGYEDITYVTPDEVKYNPVGVGTSVFTVGELSGLQVWAGCGAPSGRVEWSGTQGLSCGGTELRGWVTGPQRVSNVEIFLDGASLGTATLSGPPRLDISSKFPVHTWRLPVNLDQTARGEHTIRAVATDALGVRRQFAEQRVYFNGPGQNCVNRRRAGR
ncbi:MAG TPA: hypothetical protein VFT12_05390, partial [Thermoanaerobaculia bacterium]|nr:hypothetical protein [Thermoanaerobaculia bacterium]